MSLLNRLYRNLLARCARRHIMRHRTYIIGVTGSVGKSTASTIITQTLQQSFPTLRIHSSILNGEL